NIIHRVWFNAGVFYAFFNIFGLKIEMVRRLGLFFAPYLLLLLPYLFSMINNKNLRFAYTVSIIFLFILYNYVFLSIFVFVIYFIYICSIIQLCFRYLLRSFEFRICCYCCY